MEDKKMEKIVHLIHLVAITTSAKVCVEDAANTVDKIAETDIELEDGDIPFDVGVRVGANLDAIEMALAKLREMGW